MQRKPYLMKGKELRFHYYPKFKQNKQQLRTMHSLVVNKVDYEPLGLRFKSNKDKTLGDFFSSIPTLVDRVN